MAHQHQVVDGDIEFIINPMTRGISRANANKSSLVVGDHNSERFTFKIPKIVEGHDMSLCNVVRVHYLNTSSDNKSVQSLGLYEVDDFGPDPEDENTMQFTWLISRKATKHVGPLAFTIQFACMTGFKVDYSWQSGVFSGITVSNAVNGSEVVIEEYADIIRQWWEQLYATSELPIAVMPLEDFEALNGDTENGMLYMLLGDPAVEDLEKIPSMEQDITTMNDNITNLAQAVQSNEQDITTLNTDVDNLGKEVATAKENITELCEDVQTHAQDITTLNTDVDNLGKEVATAKENITELVSAVQINEQDISTLNTDVDNLEKKVDTNATGLTSVQEAVESLNSKWSSGEYIKIFTPRSGTTDEVYANVATGLYIIRAEYSNGAYTVSTTAIFDTLDMASASTSISFLLPSGKIAQYRICCEEIDASRGIVNIYPEYVNTVNWEILSGENERSNVTLYGRCIYTNPIVKTMVVNLNDTASVNVTPLIESLEDGDRYYVKVTGRCTVGDINAWGYKDFEGTLYLDSASPVEFKVLGTRIKSREGIMETNLGDIVIVNNTYPHDESDPGAFVTIVNNTFTLYCAFGN